jgi:hypothetical protein
LIRHAQQPRASPEQPYNLKDHNIMDGRIILSPEEAASARAEATAHQTPAASRWGDSARMVGNTARITVSGGQDNIETVANIQHGEWTELSKRDEPSSIISSARSPAGRAVSGADITGSSIVRVGNTETTVKAACAAGLLL